MGNQRARVSKMQVMSSMRFHRGILKLVSVSVPVPGPVLALFSKAGRGGWEAIVALQNCGEGACGSPSKPASRQTRRVEAGSSMIETEGLELASTVCIVVWLGQ